MDKQIRNKVLDVFQNVVNGKHTTVSDNYIASILNDNDKLENLLIKEKLGKKMIAGIFLVPFAFISSYTISSSPSVGFAAAFASLFGYIAYIGNKFYSIDNELELFDLNKEDYLEIK
ncbi:MAG: hypothetical protein J7K22_03605 [Nanoarchaeota archaeon]|nr:hypothetical protein [Nanoarchaeota archaeon]